MESFVAGKEDQGLQKRLNRDEYGYFKHKKRFKQFGVIVNDDLLVHGDEYNAGWKLHEEDLLTKRIKEEWRILMEGLPDTIFVRAYERNNNHLLRAVILGGKGMPLQDGLFFFDISFPPSYPNEPPIVTYHSYGYQPHPDLESDGKVCLDLLNTSTRKKWSTNLSKANILKVLLSIQENILNSNPDKPKKIILSLDSNEETFRSNGETMLNVMHKPPKDFEFFVEHYFRTHARTILRACLAYTDRNLQDDLYSRLYEAFLMNGSALNYFDL